MPSGVRDIQLLELKDTISQLNNTISISERAYPFPAENAAERDPKTAKRITDR